MSSVPRRSELEDGLNGATHAECDSVLPHSARTATTIAGAMVTVLVTFFFLMLFWNRFLGLRSGDGGFSGGVFLLKGILPYRDFYCPTPPLFLFRSAAVLSIFGKLPIALRAFGVLERVILSLLLYGWLVRFFRVKDAVLAALVTIVVSTGDVADPVSSYNHFTIMLAIASGLAASYALDQGRKTRAVVTIGCSAGVLSLLCLASKQTIGLGVTFAIPVVVGLCLMRLEGVHKAARFLAGFAAGWLFASGVLVCWMTHVGILHAFLTQNFIAGPAAKASHPADFVVRTVMTLNDLWWAAMSGIVILSICWRPLRRSETEEKQIADVNSLKGVLLAFVLGLGTIVASSIVLLPWDTPPFQVFQPELPAKPTIYASLIGSALLLCYYSWRFLSGNLSRRQSQFALFASIAFTVAFMTSLSFPAFEAMTIPGLALILAVLLNDFEGWRRFALYAVCVVLLFSQTQAKERMPFGFADWLEPPVKDAIMASSLPELRGFLLPPTTVDFVDSTIRIVREHSNEKDTIFVYPELGFFYGATGRRPATFSASHNIDTVPDAFARQEAERLLRARPAVLIYAPLSEQFLRREEDHWRNGKPSGQRDLIAAVETLAREYRLARTFKVFGHPVDVFVRPST